MKSCKLIISLIFVLCGVSAYGQTADEYRIKGLRCGSPWIAHQAC